jgi:hypothetical protein
VQGPQGIQGPQGLQGPQGEPGTPATLGPTLTTIEALTGTANTLLYFPGTDVAALSALSAFARTLLDDPDAAGMRGTLGVTEYEAGTFVITATGFAGTAPSGTVGYVRLGTQVTLRLPPGGLFGTSNATTFTLTGVPASLQALNQQILPCFGVDNNVLKADTFIRTPNASGVMQVEAFSGAWLASGNKGIYQIALTYLLG